MKTKFVSKYGKPITGARPRMNFTMIHGPVRSLEQAASQIEASPMPFQNPQGEIRGVGSNEQFRNQQVQGSAAPGVRPRGNTAAAPRADPPSHGAQMTATGHKPDYRAGYAPSTHPRAKARILRGAAPKTSKPFVKPMSNDDFVEGANLYRKEHGRL